MTCVALHFVVCLDISCVFDKMRDESGSVGVWVVEFKRNLAVLFDSLLQNAHLAACGYQLSHGPKMFANPEYYDHVMEHLCCHGVKFQDDDVLYFGSLNPRHIIVVGEDLKLAFDDTIRAIPQRGRHQIAPKRQTDMICVNLIADEGVDEGGCVAC